MIQFQERSEVKNVWSKLYTGFTGVMIGAVEYVECGRVEKRSAPSEIFPRGCPRAQGFMEFVAVVAD
jgi:hypothetical protein